MLSDAELNRHFATFGDYLRFLRERAELTQREFGQAVNYSDSMINRLERNLRPPNVAVVIARFIPALHLEDAPQLGKRLIELAEQARTTTVVEAEPPIAPEPEPPHTPAAAAMPESGTSDFNANDSPDPFVGREREMADARGRLQKALMGDGQIMIFSGEPGIGKTRLSNEIIARGQPLFRAFTSEAYAEGSAPYTAVTQLVRHAHSVAPSALQSLPPALLAELISRVPELQPAYPIATSPATTLNTLTSTDALTQQQNLIEGVVALCERLAAERPFIWLFEDVHWADSGSLTVLRQLARRLRKQPVVLIITHREAEIDEAAALREVLADLYRERNLLRMRLSRLNHDHTRALLQTLLPEADVAVIDAIYRETEGNPFFIAEMGKAWREAREEGGSMDAGQQLPGKLPTTLRETIQARVKKLPLDAQACLQVAATVGREFEFDILEGASDLGLERLQTALDVAERTHMISQLPSSSATLTFAFAHALIPAALQESLSGVQRQRQHLRVAQTIERLRPEQWESLAYHFRGGGQTDAARGYALRAGDRARAAYAQVEAERSYKAVLALNALPAERAYALGQMADAIGAQGRYDEARRCAEDALKLHRELGDWDGVARSYSQAIYNLWMAARFQRSYEMARDGLAELAAHPVTPAVGQLYYQAARAHEMNGRYDEAAPLLQTALEIAERHGQTELRAQTLISLGKLKHLQRRYREAEAAFNEALEVAERHGLMGVAAAAHEHIATLLVEYFARVSASREHYYKAAELARRAGDISSLVSNLTEAADISINMGEFEDAEQALAMIREWMDDLPDTGKADLDLAYEDAYLYRCKGDFVEAIRRLNALYQGNRQSAGYAQFVARNSALTLFDLWLEAGEFDHAAEVALDAITLDKQHQGQLGIQAKTRLCSIYALQNRAEASRALLNEILWQTHPDNNDRDVDRDVSVPEQISITICEARVMQCELNWAAASMKYTQSVALLDEAGMVCRKARTLREWAEACLGNNDLEAARNLLNSALHIFVQIGALDYVKMVQARLQEIELNQRGSFPRRIDASL